MRKIEEKMERAFRRELKFTSGNTAVVVTKEKQGDATVTCTEVLLHGNGIAIKYAWRYDDGREEVMIGFSMCGWCTPVTRSRLCALGIIVVQRKGKQFWQRWSMGNLISEKEIDCCKVYTVLDTREKGDQ